MTVWIVYLEHNTNIEPEIGGVFATEAGARQEAAFQIRLAQKAGSRVWNHHLPDQEDHDDWDIDVHVRPYDVIAE